MSVSPCKFTVSVFASRSFSLSPSENDLKMLNLNLKYAGPHEVERKDGTIYTSKRRWTIYCMRDDAHAPWIDIFSSSVFHATHFQILSFDPNSESRSASVSLCSYVCIGVIHEDPRKLTSTNDSQYIHFHLYLNYYDEQFSREKIFCFFSLFFIFNFQPKIEHTIVHRTHDSHRSNTDVV